MKKNNWVRDWFDKNKKYYINDINRDNIRGVSIEKTLWRFIQYVKDTAYSKGRKSGIDFALRKYINKLKNEKNNN